MTTEQSGQPAEARVTHFPLGWSISKNNDGTVGVVCHGENTPGGDIAINNAGRLEQRLLHALACAIVDAQQPAAAQEAVAWRDCVGNLYPSKESVDKYLPLGRTVHALYAAPVTASPGIDMGELAELLGIWQSNFDSGVRPDEEDEPEDAALWDRIDRIRQQAYASSKGVSEAVSVKRNCAPPSWMFPDDGGVTTGWRAKASAWLEEQAVEQERTNAAYPAHVAAYPSWVDRVHWLRALADKVVQAQASDAEGRP